MIETVCGAVERRQVPELFTEYFWTALMFYNRFKLMGLPFSGGWGEQPAHLVDVIESFESASRAVEHGRIEQWRSQKNSK